MSIDTLPSSVDEPETPEESEPSEDSLSTDELWGKLEELDQQAEDMSSQRPDEWDAAHPESAGYWREMQSISIEINRLQDVIKSREDAAKQQEVTQRKAGGTGIRFFTFRH